ncbi:uncharacterized protein LOC133272413 [Pezoporus flaviventris]|uniref:uncharacterized protein LOC133272413 n=1 Tax=Pezoporus flaviventris TaxID=889875 RepID=UPI002AAF674B|nr:uncharacterized protein LOC133272413 [Pezoporus flaviventris]
MEGPASKMCLRTCCVKGYKPLRFIENPPELRQSHLSRSCSCRMMKQRRSNSISMCILPIIPEYPGFQDIKLPRHYSETPASNRLFQDLKRGKSSSSQLHNIPNRALLVHCVGSSSRGGLKGHLPTSSGFHDKPLQEYFNERLMELRNYESKRSSRKAKAFAGENQSPFLTHRGCRRRSSCSGVVMPGHGKQREESCSSADQGNQTVIEGKDQEESQDALDIYKGDFLDALTMHITAPLEAFVQKQ